MTSAPHATRMTTKQVDHEMGHLKKDVQDLADLATQCAADPEQGLACGRIAEIAQLAHTLLLRATKVTAMRDAADLYNAELAKETK